MKKSFLVLTILLSSLVAFGQTTTTQSLDYQESSVRYVEPNQFVFTTPLIADIEVSKEKIVYTEVDAFKNIELDNYVIDNISLLKKLAVGNAAKANNADLIIGASISVVTNESEHLEITVSGFTGHYVNFRPITKDEIVLLREACTIKPGDQSFLLERPDHKIEKSLRIVEKH